MRALLPLICLLASVLTAQKRTFTDAEVLKIHKSIPLVDTHNDVTTLTVDGFDIGSRGNPQAQTDIARMKDGNVGVQFFAVYVGARFTEGNHSANRAMQMIDTVKHDIVGKYPNDFQFAGSVKEIEDARKKGKIAALMGIEGGHAIEDSLRLLRDFYDLGIRYMTLTHTNTNGWADSSGDITDTKVNHHNGLTDFGKQVIREMNRLGMLVDVSHVADKTFWDALEVSKAPIFASHSNCRAIANHARNMTDEMIIAMAKKGGVVQVNFHCPFLSQKTIDASAAGVTPTLRAKISDVVDHIEHIRKIAGIDAIGIGSDFDGDICAPVDLDDVSKMPNLTRALLERGFTVEDIRKIYGANTMRLFRAVEVAAGK